MNTVPLRINLITNSIFKLKDMYMIFIPSCHFSGVGFIFSSSQRGKHDSNIDIDVVDTQIAPSNHFMFQIICLIIQLIRYDLPIATRIYLSESNFMKGISYE